MTARAMADDSPQRAESDGNKRESSFAEPICDRWFTCKTVTLLNLQSARGAHTWSIR